MRGSLSPRHCEPPGRANARPMTGSAKQSRNLSTGNNLDCFVANAPRNDGQLSPIPGRCDSIEPGIHPPTAYDAKWIPGPRLTARPGMTAEVAARLEQRSKPRQLRLPCLFPPIPLHLARLLLRICQHARTRWEQRHVDDDSHSRTRRTQAALYLAVRPGPRCTRARDRAGHGGARFRGRLEDPERCLPEADLDDRGADRVLRGRTWHCGRRRPEEGRPRRRQGAGLFRGHDHRRARGRAAARLPVRARPWHEHRSLDARRQGARQLRRQCAEAEGRRRRLVPAQHHPDHLRRRAGAQ